MSGAGFHLRRFMDVLTVLIPKLRSIRSSILLSSILLAAVAIVSLVLPAEARDLRVAVTIKPVHSLVAAIMEGAGTPALIVEGQASPHTFALKPSSARAIEAADLFVRVSPAVEPFTTRLVETIKSPVLTLADVPGLKLLGIRRGLAFEPHGHEHGDDEHDVGDSDAKDGHIWLDPTNAAVIADAIAAELGKLDPERAATYSANAARLKERLVALDVQTAAHLAPIKGRPFIVFHDATHYFEARYGLTAAGSITLSPEVQPSAKRLSELRAKIASAGVACVFAEPFANERLLATVTEGTNVKLGTLDAEGLTLEPAPELYFTLIRALAKSVAACLAP